MNKLFTILTFTALCTAIAACGGSGSSDKVSADTTIAADKSAVAQTPNAAQDTTGSIGTENKTTTVATSAKGADLIAKSDCLSCHKEHDKLVGPSYAEVAQKYNEGDIDKLASKIIKGGAGSFGDVPMTPHPSLPANDAKEMVKYILTVK
jgi:cytochrome c